MAVTQWKPQDLHTIFWLNAVTAKYWLPTIAKIADVLTDLICLNTVSKCNSQQIEFKLTSTDLCLDLDMVPKITSDLFALTEATN